MIVATRTGWRDGQALIAAVTNPAFDALHPRGGDGRFIEKGGFVRFLDLASAMWIRAKVDEFTKDGKVKVTRSDNGDELLKPASELYQAPKAKATLSPSNWKKVGGQAGSNAGGFFEDASGEKWYVKTPQSKAHVSNENLANRLYTLAGAPAPETAVSPDGKNFLTKIEKSTDWHQLSPTELDKVRPEIRKNFVVDAWLANWDGPVNDNLRVTDDGVPLRVDAGGAVMYRARGGLRNLTPAVTELQSMRDPSVSRDGANLYAGLTQAEQEDAVKRILAIDPSTIHEMVREEGLPAKTGNDLIARRAWLAAHYGFQLPETTPEGQKLLADLKKSPNLAPTDDEKTKIASTIVKLAPDAAMPLAVGAPVWFKDKKDPSIAMPANGKAPDLMIVSALALVDPADPSKGGRVWLKSQNGKVAVGNVPINAVEVLRENFASSASKYSGGEMPQVGDRVTSSKHGDGTVLELFPLYSRVQLDDGSVRVLRVGSMQRLAQAGTDAAKPPATAPKPASPNVSGASVGKLAEITHQKAIDNFPLTVFSLPHRADVVVLAHDDASSKSAVMLGDGRRVTVADSKLYDASTVDRAAIQAMPTRTPGTRRPSAPKPPVDVSTLPTKRIKPNRNVEIEISPGDRVLKVKDGSKIDFLKISRDGVITWQGNNKAEQNYGADGLVASKDANNPVQINRVLSTARQSQWSGSRAEDITPGQYDQAAFQLGAKQMDYSNLYRKLTVPVSTGSWNARMTENFSFTPAVGDRLTAFTSPKSPDWVNPDDPSVKSSKAVVLLSRGGKVYNLGFNGENADDPSKWTTEYNSTDLDTINTLKNEYWYPHMSTPEPTATLSDGTVLTYRWLTAGRYGSASPDGRTAPNLNSVTSVNAITGQADILSGHDTRPTNQQLYGGKDALAYLSTPNIVDNWNKGDVNHVPSTPATTPTATPAGTAAPAAATPSADVTQMPGFEALKHRLPHTQEQLLSGELDDRLLELVSTDYSQTGASSGWRRVATLPDGTVQGDPILAMLQIDAKADQNAPVLASTAFNGIKEITGAPVLYRGVDTAQNLSALREGSNFAGTGVSGNGLYASNQRSTARGYGGHVTAFTIRPNSTGVDYGDLIAQQGDAIGETNLQRMGDFMGALGVQDFQSQVLTDEENPGRPISEIVKNTSLVDNVKTSFLSDISKVHTDTAAAERAYDEYQQDPHVRAALIFADKISETPDLDVSLHWGGRNGYSSGPRNHRSLIVTVDDKKYGGQATYEFKQATGSTRTGQGRAVGARKGFSVASQLQKRASGKTHEVPDLKSIQYGAYHSDQYRDAMHDVMEASGLGDALRGHKLSNSSTPQEAIDWWDALQSRMKKYDARVSVVTDPGRFAFLSGYDYFTVPQGWGGEIYHIFTHRAAMVFRK